MWRKMQKLSKSVFPIWSYLLIAPLLRILRAKKYFYNDLGKKSSAKHFVLGVPYVPGMGDTKMIKMLLFPKMS